MVEVEAYRRTAERAIGRRVAEVVAPDAWYLKRGLSATYGQAALTGRRLTGARRLGKLLLLDTDDGDGPVLGLRFGMSGRLLVDGAAGVDDLVYASNRDNPAWDRFTLRFDNGGDLRVRDPRRLGGVELDPDESRLGPDVASLRPAALAAALAGSEAPLKARLLDQGRLAGIGNLIADEALWRAGLSPVRQAGSLTPNELRRLHRHLKGTVADFLERGGSHTRDPMDQRRRGGGCPPGGTPPAPGLG